MSKKELAHHLMRTLVMLFGAGFCAGVFYQILLIGYNWPGMDSSGVCVAMVYLCIALLVSAPDFDLRLKDGKSFLSFVSILGGVMAAPLIMNHGNYTW